MKQWQIREFGIDALALEERAVPTPGPREVVVEVHAVSLNYRDLMTVTGKYNPNLQLPRVPLSDGAGIVHAIGVGVRGVKVGDRVAGIFMQNWLDGPPSAAKYRGALGGDVDGMAAQYVCLPEQGVVPVPAHLSFAEAATLPCAAVTAWSALHKAEGAHGPIGRGSTVLVLGTGGVSVAALQLAKAMGARVLGISSSDEKLERAKGLGLDEGLNYRQTPDWAEWVRSRTGGEGVDLVVEVGGQGTFARSLAAARIGGSVAEIGVLTQGGEPLDVRVILHKQLRVQGIYVGSRADFVEMNDFLEKHRLQPVVDTELPLEALPEALRQMESASHFGKLVVTMQST